MQAEHPGDRRRDQAGVRYRRERDQEDAVVELVEEIPGHLERQPCLATAASASQRQQPNVLAQQELASGRQLALPPDQRVSDHRQIRR